MLKTDAKKSEVVLFLSLIWNGLLSDSKARLTFVFILVSLFASCYFEEMGDCRLTKLAAALKAPTAMHYGSPIMQYVSCYLLHLLFGLVHNHLFYSNIHYHKSLIYRYLMKLSLESHPKSFNEIGTGKLCSILHKQADSTLFLLKYTFLKLIYTVFYMVLFFVELFRSSEINWQIRVVFVTIFLLAVGFIVMYFRACKQHKKRLIETEHANSNALLDIFRNMPVIKAFNNEKHEVARLDGFMAKQTALGRKFFTFSALFKTTFKLALFATFIIPIMLAKTNVIGIEIDPAFVWLFFQKFNAFKKSMNSLKDCLNKIFEKFVDSSASTVVSIVPQHSMSMKETLGNKVTQIRFDVVGVDLDNKLIFKDFCLCVAAGEKIAITGRNGAGKSTIIKALLGIVEYTGIITINGIDISKVNPKSLFENISYVPQEPHLFNITVMENLKYGNDTITDEKVIEICTKCGVHEIFKNLDRGYATIVGENAKNVSGGQAQMINFMRAVIRDAPIFLLDEPTSNLDYATANSLINKISTVLKDKIVFLSTHNPAHLSHFDKIININDRSVKIFNSHEDFYSDPNFEFKL